MKSGAVLLSAAMLLTACGSSQDDRSALATPQPTALATQQGGASEAARAAGAESRKVTVPMIRDVPASGVASAMAATVAPRSGASSAAAITPPSGASEAAKAAGAESREVAIPKTSDVPAGGVMAAPSVVAGASAASSGVPAGGVTVAANGDDLPPGVPYASDSDPVRIVSYVLSSTVIHPGDDITGDVVTSSNAASVTARVGSFSVAVPKVAQGKFHLQMKMPSVPLPPGDAKLIITAIRTDGKSTTREVAITVAL